MTNYFDDQRVQIEFWLTIISVYKPILFGKNSLISGALYSFETFSSAKI